MVADSDTGLLIPAADGEEDIDRQQQQAAGKSQGMFAGGRRAVILKILCLSSGVLFLLVILTVVYFVAAEVVKSQRSLPHSSNSTTSLEWHMSDKFPGPCLSLRQEECDTVCREAESAYAGRCYRIACWCGWMTSKRTSAL